MGYFTIEPLFPLGEILVSPGVLELKIDIHPLLRRHQAGDFGDICPEDVQSNNQALLNDEAILSQYLVDLPSGRREILVAMTEADRSLTVVLLLCEPGMLPDDE